MPRSSAPRRDSSDLETFSLDLEPGFVQFVSEHFRSQVRSPPTPTLGAVANRIRMASSTSTATPVKHSFDARVAAVRLPKSDINAVILDYLTMEGYPKAAANFAKEANIPEHQDIASIMARQQIQTHIHKGHIAEAVQELNDLDTEILGNDPKLHFELLRLQLVELIRTSTDDDIQDVLEFAQQQLAPRAPANDEFVKELESTMSLLFFPKTDLPNDLKHLLHPDLRRKVAEMVNKAVLDQQMQRRTSTIRKLVRLRLWSETTARQRKVELPGQIRMCFHVERDDRDMVDGHLSDIDPEVVMT